MTLYVDARRKAVHMQVCLADHQICKLIDNGHIRVPKGYTPSIQPASLDVTAEPLLWQVVAAELPGHDRKVIDVVEANFIADLEASQGNLLHVGCTYVVRLREKLYLPNTVGAIANTKSSIGRLGIHVRILTDYCDRYDVIPAGYNGDVYAEITPLAFPIVVARGTSLTQLRFAQTLATNNSLGHVNLTVDLSLTTTCYRARRYANAIDLDWVDFYDPTDFWDTVPAPDGHLLLEPGAFYILASQEFIHIPASLAAEITPYNHMRGEFRAHYAGFVDPGFNGRIVYEIRAYETPFVLRHGQSVAKLQYIPMATEPDATYGPSIGSSYQNQDLKLSRHFKLATGQAAV